MACDCCGGGACPCTCCAGIGYYDSYDLTISGYNYNIISCGGGGGICDCTRMNGTFRLNKVGGSPCSWESTALYSDDFCPDNDTHPAVNQPLWQFHCVGGAWTGGDALGGGIQDGFGGAVNECAGGSPRFINFGTGRCCSTPIFPLPGGVSITITGVGTFHTCGASLVFAEDEEGVQFEVPGPPPLKKEKIFVQMPNGEVVEKMWDGYSPLTVRSKPVDPSKIRTVPVQEKFCIYLGEEVGSARTSRCKKKYRCDNGYGVVTPCVESSGRLGEGNGCQGCPGYVAEGSSVI